MTLFAVGSTLNGAKSFMAVMGVAEKLKSDTIIFLGNSGWDKIYIIHHLSDTHDASEGATRLPTYPLLSVMAPPKRPSALGIWIPPLTNVWTDVTRTEILTAHESGEKIRASTSRKK